MAVVASCSSALGTGSSRSAEGSSTSAIPPFPTYSTSATACAVREHESVFECGALARKGN
eukprot:4278402-Amphidinium_carterae.1